MNELERRVLELIGENPDSPDVYTDGSDAFDQLRASVNDAIQAMCAVTGSYTQVYHLTMLDGRQFYRLFSQQDYFGYPVEVWDRESRHKLEQSALSSIFRHDGFAMEAAGAPQVYGQLGHNVLWFWPFDSNAGRVIEIRAVMIPKAYEDDKQPIKVRENYRNAAVAYAASELFATRGDASRATQYFQEYLKTAGLIGLQPQQAERFYSRDRRTSRWGGQPE